MRAALNHISTPVSDGVTPIKIATDYYRSNWLLAHPLYHTYPFASIFGYYYDHPWSFYFPRWRGWGWGGYYGWGYSYGWGCYFCYYPTFYSTPLGWGYGAYVDYYHAIDSVIVDPYSLDIVEGGDFVEVNYKLF